MCIDLFADQEEMQSREKVWKHMNNVDAARSFLDKFWVLMNEG